jgi:hypothetical protein
VKQDKTILDKYLQEQMQDDAFELNEAHWQHALAALEQEDKDRKAIAWWKIIAFVGVMVAGALGYLFTSTHKDNASNHDVTKDVIVNGKSKSTDATNTTTSTNILEEQNNANATSTAQQTNTTNDVETNTVSSSSSASASSSSPSNTTTTSSRKKGNKKSTTAQEQTTTVQQSQAEPNTTTLQTEEETQSTELEYMPTSAIPTNKKVLKESFGRITLSKIRKLFNKKKLQQPILVVPSEEESKNESAPIVSNVATSVENKTTEKKQKKSSIKNGEAQPVASKKEKEAKTIKQKTKTESKQNNDANSKANSNAIVSAHENSTNKTENTKAENDAPAKTNTSPSPTVVVNGKLVTEKKDEDESWTNVKSKTIEIKPHADKKDTASTIFAEKQEATTAVNKKENEANENKKVESKSSATPPKDSVVTASAETPKPKKAIEKSTAGFVTSVGASAVPKIAAPTQYQVNPTVALNYLFPITTRFNIYGGLGLGYMNKLPYQYRATNYKYGFGVDSTVFTLQQKTLIQMHAPITMAYKLGVKHHLLLGAGATINLALINSVKDFSATAASATSGYQNGFTPFLGFGSAGYQYQINNNMALQLMYQAYWQDATNNTFFGNTNNDLLNRINFNFTYQLNNK